MAFYIHPRELWTERECKKRAAHINRDGLGTVGGPRGLVSGSSSPYPSYGQSQRYNGGCIRDGEWYEGESVPLPIIPHYYEFHVVVSWGIVIRLK